MRWTISFSQSKFGFERFPGRGEFDDLLLKLSTLWATTRFGIVHDETKLLASTKPAKSNPSCRERLRLVDEALALRLCHELPAAEGRAKRDCAGARRLFSGPNLFRLAGGFSPARLPYPPRLAELPSLLSTAATAGP